MCLTIDRNTDSKSESYRERRSFNNILAGEKKTRWLAYTWHTSWREIYFHVANHRYITLSSLPCSYSNEKWKEFNYYYLTSSPTETLSFLFKPRSYHHPAYGSKWFKRTQLTEVQLTPTMPHQPIQSSYNRWM